MANFGSLDFQRIAAAAVGALVLSTACISAAVGPARAVETSAVESFAAATVQTSDRAEA